jgi:tape measure domain-containing protein
MTDTVVTLRIAADGSVLSAAAQKAGRDVAAVGDRASSAGRKVDEGMRKGASGATYLSRAIADVQRQLSNTVAVAGLAALTLGIVRSADAMSTLRARIGLVVDGQAAAADAQQRVFEIAQKTGTAIDATASLAVKNARVFMSMGDSQAVAMQKSLALTETIQKSLTVSGASAEESRSLVLQLGQALQSGVLQGDEFRSVMENGGRVIQALTDYTGKSVAQLRLMAEQGKLTSSLVLEALAASAGKINDEFARMPVTVARAFTELTNAVKVYIGDADQAAGSSRAVATALHLVAENLGTLLNVIAIVGAAWLTRYVAGAAVAIARSGMLAVAARAVAAEMGIAAAASGGLGASLLAFAGGPVGVVLLSLGALAALYVTLRQHEEEQRAQFEAGIRTMQAQTEAAERLHSAMQSLSELPPPIADVGKAYTDSLALAAQKQDEFNRKRAELEAVEYRIKAAQQSTNEAAGLQLPALAEKAARLRTEMEQLGVELDKMRGASDALGSDLASRLAPGLDRVTDAVARLRGASTLGGVFAAIQAGVDGLARSGAIAGADAQFQTLFASITTKASKAAEDVKTAGKTAVQVAKAEASALLEQARAANYTPEQVAAVKAKTDAYVANVAAIEAAKKSHSGLSEADRLAAQQARERERETRQETAALERLDAINEEYAAGLGGPMAQAVAAHNRRLAELTKIQAELLDQGPPTVEVSSKIAEAMRGEATAYETATEAAQRALDKRSDVLGTFLEELGRSDGALTASAARQKAVAAAVEKVTDAYNKNTAANIRNKQSLDEVRAGAAAAAGAAFDIAQADELISQFADESPVLKIADQVETLEKALKAVSDRNSDAFDPEKAEKYRKAIEAANQQIGVRMVGSYAALLGATRAFTKEGSKSYQQITAGMAALQLVQDALALRAAVIAVLTQGEGEPYSAWARMAAMAAAVAPYLASIGQTISSIGGGSGAPSRDSAEVRQQTQGTGSVLGDAKAQSESIANAVEITANATTQLVGLNRGMLDALRSLQAALGAAGNLLARGAGDVTFPGFGGGSRGALEPLLDPFGIDPLGNFMSNDPIGSAVGGFLWGGDKKVIDQGILIAGGKLQDMLNGIVVGAYRTIETDGGLFGSDSTSDQLVDVSDQFARQFQLVINSIADTVRQGALALGLLPADVEAAIASYQVEATRISLEGLSAEDQQAALEAVFSKLFDGLAGAVVPFIDQFQQVGEGLGETLVRVATEVQVTQEAFRQLGLAVDETDPERFAQLADGLVQAAGGIDAFISGMQSFVSNFAPDSQKLRVSTDALSSALSQVGLSLPATRDGMWQLMQSLDATTEEGRKQIATLLSLADAADAYYDALDDNAKKIADARALLDSVGVHTGLTEFGQSLQAIQAQERKAIDAANMLAQAQGRTGASTAQIAQIHDWASRQIAAAMRRLQATIRDQVAELYGGIPGTLDAINARIGELEQASGSFGNSVRDLGDAGNQLFEQWRDGIKSLSDYLDSSLFGDLSPLNPEQQVAEAQRQLDEALAAAAGGDATALASLPQLMEQFARLYRDSQSSGGDFNGVIENYRQQLMALLGMPNPGTQQGGDSNPIAVAVSASPELQALYAARDAALAQQENEHRAVLAQQLAQNLHDMAVLTRTPILEMIALQDVALTDLARDMGVDLNNLTAESVLALGNMATTLGISLTDLTSELGINLTDLGAGVTDLTERLGIDLSNLTVSSTESLAALATSLGADVADLARSVGVDLGSLADSQSLLNQALGDTINQLPQEQRDKLQPLFDAIANATTEADANAAIKALEDAVNETGGDVAAALAPYLPDVFPPEALNQLDYLGEIQDIGRRQLDVLKAIARGLDVPGYAIGSAYIRGDQLAMVHDGEMVIDPSSAAALRKYGIRIAGGGGGASDEQFAAVVVELRALRSEVARLRAESTSAVRENTGAVRDEGQRAYRQREEMRRDGSIKRGMG